MRAETFKSKSLLYNDPGSLSPSLFIFDLPLLIEKMKQKQSWIDGELDAMILLKTPAKQIVLTALHEGTEIYSFQSNDSITFQIIEGKLIFHTPKESVTLNQGQLLTLRENVKYSLTANEETVLLLTIASDGLQLSVN